MGMKKSFKRLMVVCLVFLFCFSLISGCSSNNTANKAQESSKQEASKQETSKTPVPEAKKADVTLKVLVYADPWFDEVFKDFESKNPGIKIERKKSEGVDSGVLMPLMQSNDGPDIILLNSGPGRIGPLVKAGLVEDLTGAYDARKWNEKVAPAVLNVLKKSNPKLYEICNGLDIFQVYYFKKVFADNGIQVPTTYDQFIDNAKKIKKSGELPLALGLRDNFAGGWLVGNLYQSASDVDFMTSIIYGDAKFTDEKLIKAAKALKGLVDDGIIAKDSLALNNLEARTIFATGKAAMMVTAQGQISDILKDGSVKEEDIGVFPMPSMTAGNKAIPTSGLAHSWIMNANSKNKDQAYKFLDYVASKDYIAKLSALKAWMYGAPAINLTDDVQVASVIKSAVESIKGGSGYNPSVYVSGDVKNAYYAANQAIISGTKSPEQAMKDIQTAKEKK